MKIRLMSDLHTEFRLPYKSQPFNDYHGEDVLVLAGDIASGSKNTVEVLQHFADIFPQVVYVPGNHEYYGSSFHEFNTKMIAKCAKLDNVHFLHRDTVQLGGVWFIGATLWTNFNKDPLSEHAARKMIADFRLIRDFKTADAVEQYYLDREYLKMAYENFVGPKVIVTHFLPARECISPRFKSDNSGLNDYFANNLGDWIWDLRDTTWMFGHTHDPVDLWLGETRVVANPHGYWTAADEGQHFDPYKTITL